MRNDRGESMSLYFKFNDQLKTDMQSILMNLNKENAIKLVFDNKKEAKKCGTHLITVDGTNVNNNYKFQEPKKNNVYFFFDKDFNCQYIGKKGNQEGINYRLGLHLLKNETTISSAIDKVCEYLNGIQTGQRIIYIITFEINPSYMAEGVESYFIDWFRNKGGAEWISRK